ncbi:hypothetical protein [Flavobacterium sp. GT3R68]|uniref:hypothetical protein n=1 Tax=Flavobacterium sp. GT3R68 TaxID=2594437 RepID=UPI000F862743|nr:hypothetical protein [Flavobacterium sp. GT3R68]RTY89634.1 hypothetical protein EKL32_22160 [Flavobacterium sp. GSN2]TRW89479.1 hypothetical protein FNW07_13350 [Flavobacterium sp. GT3R68]
MKYIKHCLLDIENVYVPQIEYLNDDFFGINDDFINSNEVIKRSMKFYEIEVDAEDFEKLPISYKEFNNKNKNHFYKGLNYEYLLDNIDLEIFKLELTTLISTQEKRFLESITNELENSLSDIKFTKMLINNIEEILKTSNNLKSLIGNSNSINELVLKEYLKSYSRCYKSLKDEYYHLSPHLFDKNEEIPVLSRDEILNNLIGRNTNNLRTFLEYERKLISLKYLDNSRGKWLKKSANLVRFYNHCENKNLFKDFYENNSEGIKFLRDLYDFHEKNSIDTPEKRKLQLTRKTKSEFHFLDII